MPELKEKWVVAVQERGEMYSEYVIEAEVGAEEEDVLEEFYDSDNNVPVKTRFKQRDLDVLSVEKL